MVEKAGVHAKAQESKQKFSSFCKRKSDYDSSMSPSDRILQLQRTAGNQAVQRLIKSRALQAKLRIGQPNDIYEQEADRVAEQVMRMPLKTGDSNQSSVNNTNTKPVIQLKPGCPFAKGSRCGEEELVQPKPLSITSLLQRQTEEEEEPVRMKRENWASPFFTPSVESSINSLKGGGKPLSESDRAFFEPRFRADFSGVRVHNGSKAAEIANSINAKAFTVGNNIAFGGGQFVPGTSKGRELIAHELTHVVQQSGATQGVLQRDIGFEFQTKNLVRGEKGREFERGFGGFLHSVPPTDKKGVKLVIDTGSVVEFETHHFRRWSELEVQIRNAVDIVKEIKKDPKAFPFNQQKNFQKLLRKGERLEIDITDSNFVAKIQSTEGFALSQYESSLKEHERTELVTPVINSAQKILADAQKANKKISSGKVENLRGFLQVIVDYILNAQERVSKAEKPSPVKARFRLLARTNFSSIFSSALSPDEQTLFKWIVTSDAIPKELGLSGTDQFFPDGYWGHLGGGGEWTLFQRGKVVAVATEDKQTIHDCSSKTKTPGLDVSKCGRKVPDSEITIGEWLNSIIKQKSDKLSPPPYGGSKAMGEFPVRSAGGEKGLVVFETRGETHRKQLQPVDKWVDFAEDIFREAATCRPRPGTGTELIYDGTKKPFDPKNCP